MNKENVCIRIDGVRKVFIIDGRVPHALLIECLTDEGAGTMFKQELNPHYSVK